MALILFNGLRMTLLVPIASTARKDPGGRNGPSDRSGKSGRSCRCGRESDWRNSCGPMKRKRKNYRKA